MMGKCATILLVALLFTTFAWGQIPSGNVFIGYSYTQTNLVPGQSTNMNGWNGSVEGQFLPLLGVVADLSGHYGSQVTTISGIGGSANLSEYNFLFGPRLSFKLHKFRPFVHALFGGGHIGASLRGASTSSSSFADALGGGFDYRLVPLISWRVQLDALQTRFFSTSQTNPRFSTGIAIHF
jgi:Outer membrane protein beta-barrel domain